MAAKHHRWDNGLAFYCLRRRRDAAMQAAASLAKRQSIRILMTPGRDIKPVDDR
jgi:hypothetical protein